MPLRGSAETPANSQGKPSYSVKHTGVPLLCEQFQLVVGFGEQVLMCGVCKYLDNRLFLEYGDAQNLENCVKAPVQVQPLPDDGYQDVPRAGDPHLRLPGVLRGPEDPLD